MDEIERHLFQDWDRYLIQSLQLKMLLMSHFDFDVGRINRVHLQNVQDPNSWA